MNINVNSYRVNPLCQTQPENNRKQNNSKNPYYCQDYRTQINQTRTPSQDSFTPNFNQILEEELSKDAVQLVLSKKR